MKRITCSDLGLTPACRQVIEAETDEEVLARAAEHARDVHSVDDLDQEKARSLITAGEPR
jgi:predicted small metal-binding protein